MDKEYDDHAWCKVETTNIKNSFSLGFEMLNVWAISGDEMTLVLFFFIYNVHNEIDWSSDLSQVLVANEIVPPPPFCTIAYKAWGFSPMCV
jgi:hypothetical protein